MIEGKKYTVVTKSMQIGEIVFEVDLVMDGSALTFESLRIRNNNSGEVLGDIKENVLKPLIDFLKSVGENPTSMSMVNYPSFEKPGDCWTTVKYSNTGESTLNSPIEISNIPTTLAQVYENTNKDI